MGPRRNKAVTIFSPGGRLLQVEYAQIGVRRGSTAVGVCGHNCVVLALEQNSFRAQQVEKSGRRIFAVDTNLIMSYAGLTPDARILLDRARRQCQKHNSVTELPVAVKHITKYIANLQLKHTQIPDVRPFGVSCLVAGFDPDRTPHLFQTDPSGNFYEFTATAIGRSGRTAQEYLEANYSEEAVRTCSRAIKLAISALLEVARHGQTDFEVTVLKQNHQLLRLHSEMIAEYVAAIEGGIEMDI